MDARHNARMVQAKGPLRVLALSSCACALLATFGVLGADGTGGDTTVIVVRHAEKAPVPGSDPPLSESGQKRAAALRRTLERAGVSAIYATQYLRTQQTVAPLADLLKIPVTVVDASKTSALVEQIRGKNRGQTVLVAAHGNTAPEIIKALGVAETPAIGEEDFGDMFVITVPANGPARLLHLRYGP